MRRDVVVAVVKLCVEAFLITLFVGIIVVIIGQVNKWDTPLKYSNGFFFAGLMIMVAGMSSRLGANQEWEISQRLSSESFRNMSPGERQSMVVDASSSFRLVFLGVASGILLILISVLVWKLF